MTTGKSAVLCRVTYNEINCDYFYLPTVKVQKRSSFCINSQISIAFNVETFDTEKTKDFILYMVIIIVNYCVENSRCLN